MRCPMQRGAKISSHRSRAAQELLKRCTWSSGMNSVGSPTGKMLRKEASYLPACSRHAQERYLNSSYSTVGDHTPIKHSWLQVRRKAVSKGHA